MGRKLRLKKLEEKRKAREEINFKKKNYHEMAKNGELGCKELQNYTMMYESLTKEKRNGCKHPDDEPKRNDYNQLKSLYSSNNTSSLENKSYSSGR
jgi:hypothetical protein